MKVLIFEGSLRPPTFIRILANKLAESGLDCYLAGYGRMPSIKKSNERLQLVSLGNSKNPVYELIQVLRLSIVAFFHKPNSTVQYLKRLLACKDPWRTKLRKLGLYALITRLNPDIVHLQWASHIQLFLDLMEHKSYANRPKYIVSLRGRLVNVSPNTDKSIETLYKQTFPKVDAFHAVSKAIACEAQRWGAFQDKIRVIYSGIDMEKISRFQKSSWQSGQPFKMLSAGRHHWIKGYRYALEALRKLTEDGFLVQYTLLAGPAHEEILYNIQSLGLEDCVSLLPNLPQEEVFQLMQESDFLLLPSVEEGIANVVLEAMAIGLPVISSDCGGMAEVIEHRKNGLLFEKRNVESLVIEVEYLLRMSPEERRLMATMARQTVLQQHGKNRLGEEMLEFYNAVLSKDLKDTDRSSHQKVNIEI